MNRFYDDIIEPVFEMEKVINVMEIGAKLGDNTKKLIHYANKTGGKVYSIDPCPDFPADDWEKENAGHFIMLRDLSLHVMGKIKDADAVLIDGDHNWYTVYNELCELAKAYPAEKFPLVMFHDIGWPYDRRDLYYSPETIPEQYRHPYEKKAIYPGCSELSNEGINEGLFNAVYEGGPKNGVRTAVEDFILENPDLSLQFYMIEALHGLGMIASERRHSQAIEYFTSTEAVKKAVILGEKDRLKEMIKNASLHKKVDFFRKKVDSFKRRNVIPHIFADYGQGFSPKMSWSFGKYDDESENFYGEFIFEKAPDRIRFDPVDGQYCIVDSVKAVTEKGGIDLFHCNGREVEGFYLFDHSDPQFIFDNTKKALCFRIRANIHAFVGITEFEMIARLMETVREQEEKIEYWVREAEKNAEAAGCWVEELKNTKAEKTEVLGELENCKAELNAKSRESETEIKKLCEQISNLRGQMANSREQIVNLSNKNMDLEQKIGDGKNRESFYQQEASRHFNSVRYRIGTAMVDALHSPKAFFALPSRLIKIYKEKDNLPVRSLSEIAVPAVDTVPRSDHQDSVRAKKSMIPMLTKEQILKDNRNMMTDYAVKGNPLVSIIIVNHNGTRNLKTLFDSFENCDFYDNYEIIIIDNASSDESVHFIDDYKEKLKITLIQNKKNESFSKANNQGITCARGEYICFMNNDIEVTDQWLDHLLYTAQTQPDCGAVGARLVYPLVPDDSINAGKSFTIQHMGVYYIHSSFDNEYFIRPVNGYNGKMPLLSLMDSNMPFAVSSVTAACMLVKKSVAEEVGCFDEQFVYGYEDCDFSLRLFRKGYKNYVSPFALLFHYEFGTQCTSGKAEIVSRRTNNIHRFKEKWQEYLKEMIWNDKLSGTSYFTNIPLTIAVVVTDDAPTTSAGDYFTGLELCRALEKKGCKTKFLSMKNDCYDVGMETDVLISLLEKYDITRIKNAADSLVTIAWARNWFERWCQVPYIENYTYIFASSKTACDYMKKELNREITLFPIAANTSAFKSDNTISEEERKKFGSDYVFTGSYWNDPREIIDIINPEDLSYKFKIFGANWNRIEKFKNYNAGFVNYNEMPKVYAGTKIVIDDANRVTKPYGAVNSRVFDALAAGRLVITNGTLGAKETFEGRLPSFNSREEFNAMINKYMTDDEAYRSKVEELREFVLKNHTYEIRAEFLIDFLKSEKLLNKKKVAILAPVPKWEERNAWGDFHFAEAMKKCFEKSGYTVEIRILSQWKDGFDGKYVIVLRGLSLYEPKNQHVNIMWNISHPDKVAIDEYNLYDCVYISSEKWAAEIAGKASTTVRPLMQCTDPEVFGKELKTRGKKKYELLFVGNSRKIMRKIISDVIPCEYDLSVYGSNWEGLIDKKYIKGQSIPNSELWKEYANSCILLNDHWDDMREKGFVSNRLFDGLAAGAFIISDRMEEIDALFDGCVVTYKDKEDLKEHIRKYMGDSKKRQELAERGRRIVLEKHTFQNRMEVVMGFMEGRDGINV